MQSSTQITVWGIIVPILNLALLALAGWLIALVIRALRKYLRGTEVRKEKEAVRRSLGEAIRAHRTALGMTQEFIAESLGVSRQAVSKWESGASDPSTANLFALADLFGISPETLLKDVHK